MKLFSLIILLSFSTLCPVFGENKADSTANKWKQVMTSGINLNQSSFSDNWKGGGTNTFALGWYLNHSANVSNESWRLNSDLN